MDAVEGSVRDASLILSEAAASMQTVTAMAGIVERVADVCTRALQAGGKLFFCGNGGSAADAQHLAAEFLGRFLVDRSPWAAIALSTNSSAVTAIGNDYGYDDIFARQLKGLGRAGDVLFGISTSGRSRNVVKAFEVARETGIYTIALTGAAESPMGDLADAAIRVPATSTPRIQEMHIVVGHTICEIVEAAIVRSAA